MTEPSTTVSTGEPGGGGRSWGPPPTRPAVLLVVPPGGQYAYPNLGPASLAGHLAGMSVPCDVEDLNVAGFHDLCRPERVDALVDRVAALESHDSGELARHRDVAHLRSFLRDLDGPARRRLSAVPDRLRDPAVLADRTTWTEVLHHLGLLANLVELGYPPLRFLPGSLIGGMFSALRRPSEWREIETPYDPFVAAAVDRIDWSDHDIVGLSAFTFDQLVFAYRMAPALRERAPHALLALGGNVLGESEIPPSLQAVLTAEFDVVVRGDGELPIERIVEHVERGIPLDEVPNAFFRRDGSVVHAPARYRYRFESRRAPDFSGFPLDLYLLPEPVLPFRLSNGCDWGRCTFCSESKEQGEITARRSYREPEPEQVADHLEDLARQHGTRMFINCSSLVTAEGAADIGDAIVARGLDVSWYAMVRAEAGWTPDRIDRAVKGGAAALNFGIESYHPRVNRLMRKGINLRHVPDQLRAFRDLGTFVTLYTLCNFPTETLEEFEEHLAEVRRQTGDTHDVVFKSNFMLVADAPVAEQPVAFGIDPVPLERRLEDLRDQPLPLYLVPDEVSGNPVHREPGDGFEEKLDRYHAMYLDLALDRPLYFNRDLEIVSLRPHWEPELALTAARRGTPTGPVGMTLRELLAAGLTLTEGVQVEELGNGLVAVVDPSRPLARYYGGMTAVVLVALRDGTDLATAFRDALAACDPTAKEVLELYEELHRPLRDLGVVEVSDGRPLTAVGSAAATAAGTGEARP